MIVIIVIIVSGLKLCHFDLPTMESEVHVPFIDFSLALSWYSYKTSNTVIDAVLKMEISIA